ncbi:hypothetical protein MCOR01_004915 [Pyricularia oryzae]|nr:hypothetical protein MCOR01_004915 [Pyricularia oryzae]
MLPVAVQHAHSRRQTQAAGFCHDGMPVESMAIQALRHDCSPPPGLMAAVTDKIPGSTFLDFAARKTSAANMFVGAATGATTAASGYSYRSRCD